MPPCVVKISIIVNGDKAKIRSIDRFIISTIPIIVPDIDGLLM